MSQTKLRPEPAATVTRTLALAEPAGVGQVERLRDAEGVIAVTASADGKRLAVTYDVRATVMDALVVVARGLGLRPANGPLARMGRAFAGFRDDNLRNQAGLEHHCCSAPPPAGRDQR
jgi:hypothetical protein